MPRISLLAVVCLVGSGCSTAYRFGVGPTIDTGGRVGLEVYAGGSIGIADTDANVAVEETFELGVGTEIVPGTFVLSPTGGLDFVDEGDRFAWRIGLRGGGHFAFDAHVRTRFVSGLAGALLVRTGGSDGPWIGPELRVAIAGDDQRIDGLFRLGFVFEAREMDDPFDDLFERD